MKFPVFDLHCDTSFAMLGKDLMGLKPLDNNDLHIDLNRAKKLDGYAQCFGCFTTPGFREWHQASPLVVFEREMGAILSEMERNSGVIRQAFSANEIRENYENGIMSGILTIEGPAGFGFDPGLLQDLHMVGFRMTSLGWNEQNPLTGSHKTGGGLTEQGREFVREAQRVGMMVDVSHISDEGFWNIMDITEKPIVASHSNSRAVCDVSRNLTDDMFRAICQTGGTVGFNHCAPFVGKDPNLDTAADHILHFLELDPDCRHISLGGDLDGCDELTGGINGIQDYPKMAEVLLRRGLTEEMVRRIFWDNALEVLEKCCM